MSFLKSLRIANAKRDAQWDPDHKITPLFRAVELSGEVGELANLVKKLERHKLGLVGSTPSMAAVHEEVADILICLDLLAMTYSIDLEKVTAQKFAETSKKHSLYNTLPSAHLTVEYAIMYDLILAIISEGWEVQIEDEEDVVLPWGRYHQSMLFYAVANTDETCIYLRHNGEEGYILLIHGNGTDLITDYTDLTWIEELIDPIIRKYS